MKLLKGFLPLLIALAINLQASYIYKDELSSNAIFASDIEKIGEELYAKTGIKLVLAMYKKLPTSDMVEFEKDILSNYTSPTIILALSANDMKVDILVNDNSLYNLFNKKQILSPAASFVQGLVLALFYSDSFEHSKEILLNADGSILPILSQKTKPNEDASKYAAAMFNGYVDIASQVSKAKGIMLDNSVGESNQVSFLILKIIFYGVLVYALFLYIKRRYLKRRAN